MMSLLKLHQDRLTTVIGHIAGLLALPYLAHPTSSLWMILILLAFSLMAWGHSGARRLIHTRTATLYVPCDTGVEWWILTANELLSVLSAAFVAIIFWAQTESWFVVPAFLAAVTLWRIARWKLYGIYEIGSPDFMIDSVGCALYASIAVAGILFSSNVAFVGYCLTIALTYAFRTVWAVMYPERCGPLKDTVPAGQVF